MRIFNLGLAGTAWAFLRLEERGTARRAKVDWWGNVSFALGLVLAMTSVTYGLRSTTSSLARRASPGSTRPSSTSPPSAMATARS